MAHGKIKEALEAYSDRLLQNNRLSLAHVLQIVSVEVIEPFSLRLVAQNKLQLELLKNDLRPLKDFLSEYLNTNEVKIKLVLEKEPKVTDIIDGRFRLVKLLSQGRYGSVWIALDVRTNIKYVIKLFRKRNSTIIKEYLHYLRKVQDFLDKKPIPVELSLPKLTETLDSTYQLSNYEPELKPLKQKLNSVGPFPPEKALTLVSQLFGVVNFLHNENIIHGDIKPANILVNDDLSEIRLIDMGMVKQIEGEQKALIFGTYAYMHPSLKVAGSMALGDSTIPSVLECKIGPFIDLYALGITLLELLTNDNKVPRLDIKNILDHIKNENPWIDSQEEPIAVTLAEFIVRLLQIQPDSEFARAKHLSSVTAKLAGKFPSVTHDEMGKELKEETKNQDDGTRVAIYSTLHGGLERVEEELSEKTIAYQIDPVEIKTIETSEDDELSHQLTEVFHNALNRAKTSWKIGVGMTISSFFVIVSMVVIAIVLTIYDGDSSWALIFGGLSVTTVIGTLIWKPYDRIFRATILTQQIEIIHFQTITGFKGVDNVTQQVQICRQAVEDLKALFNMESGT